MSKTIDFTKGSRQGLSRRTFLTGSVSAAAAASVGVSFGEVDLAQASWGGHANGRIPVSVLSPVPWDTVRILRTDARDALVALNGSFRAHFGHDLTVNDGYRDYAEQVRAKQKYGQNAATPGTSNHGWAIAVDLARPNRVQLSFSHPIYGWLKTNAGQYGWVHPRWAEPNGSRPEAWHWEYNGSFSNSTPATPTPTREDVMYSIVVNGNMYIIGKQYLRHHPTGSEAQTTRNVTSASDELFTLDVPGLVDLLNGLGIPPSVLDGNGRVLNPATGAFLVGGTWSRELEILAKLATL